MSMEIEPSMHLDLVIGRPLVTGKDGKVFKLALQIRAQQKVAQLDPFVYDHGVVDWPTLRIVMTCGKIKTSCS